MSFITPNDLTTDQIYDYLHELYIDIVATDEGSDSSKILWDQYELFRVELEKRGEGCLD